MIVFSGPAPSATEGASASLQFNFTTDPGDTYYYETRDGTAVSGTDYVPASGTILPLQTGFITVALLNDSIYDGDETVFVDLYQDVIRFDPESSFATFVTRELVTSVMGTIVDDDAPPSIALTPATISLAEGNVGTTTDFVYTVTRGALSQQPQTVDYSVSTLGANPVSQNDFVAASGTVTFAPNETVQHFTIQVQGDATFESDENFAVYLTNPNFGTASGSAAGVIQNDDSQPPPPPPPPGSSGPSPSPTSGDDLLTGTPGDDTLAGLAGNDTVSGLDSNDILYGNQDQDSIDAAGGNDTVYGGRGDDSINGGAGNDLLFGNEGSDNINAGEGNNTIVGGQDSTDGADRITSGAGNDVIFGNGGNDSISAGGGNDSVIGGFGDDILFGNQGNDIILGNEGNDLIFGGIGEDTLVGGAGNDTLVGNEGNDVLSGNEGADRFVFGIPSGADVVNGFSANEGDRLDLQGQTYTTSQDANGNAVLTLSGGGVITLIGVASNQVNASFFSS